jgi:glucokinase
MNTINKHDQSQPTIGIDLGGTNVRVGLIEKGKVIKHASAKIPQTATDKQKVLQCIIETIEKVIVPDVVGFGIGIPGLMDKKQGIIHAITNIPSFNSFPIKKTLSDYFNVPVFIDNDVNCFILGEKHNGAGKNFRNVVGLSLGTGMGVGIISGNQLLEDANGGSGEFGEVPYRDANLEAYCSGMFFKRSLNKTGDEVFKLAQQGNKDALEVFQQFGMHLGKAIHIILLALDPQAIIIGGSVALSKQYFNDAMMKEVANFVFKNSLKNLTIVYATEKYSPVLGAAKLIELNTGH